MLVDDDRGFVIVQSVVLRRVGYEVLVAADAVPAVSVAVRERPQVVIMDIGLPGGDRTTVMQRLHALPSLAGIPSSCCRAVIRGDTSRRRLVPPPRT
jgi:CheY-like chemotaxis protein